MPGLEIFLPSLKLPAFVCRNCGFWQRSLEKPIDCPICKDYRHILPPNGWSFYDAKEAKQAYAMKWEEILPGVWHFWNDPVEGIGSHSYLIKNSAGNILFEGATIYSNEALEWISHLGGVRFASASHPHTYGALWQLQDFFDAHIALHTGDLGWSNAFQVTHPFDDQLFLCPTVRLIHAGVHFEGHSFLVNEDKKIVFCGDSMKFDFLANNLHSAIGISSHKSFVRNIPLSPSESAKYRNIFCQIDFDIAFSPFEQVFNVNSKLVDNYFLMQSQGSLHANFYKLSDFNEKE